MGQKINPLGFRLGATQGMKQRLNTVMINFSKENLVLSNPYKEQEPKPQAGC
jgi:hypothetical protein